MKNTIIFISLILLPVLIGAISGFFTSSAISSWYLQINKPVFTPPNYLFGPVWTLLYFLMGVSSYIIWQKRAEFKIKKAFAIYFTQLVFNFLWSLLFFGLRNPLLGLFDIFILLLLIIYMIYEFYKIDQKAALLQIPYLLWVSFATILNLSIVLLN